MRRFLPLVFLLLATGCPKRPPVNPHDQPVPEPTIPEPGPLPGPNDPLPQPQDTPT